MDKKTEIISLIERHRRWGRDEKLSILAEAFEPGATAATVADRNGVSRSLLYNWLKLAREGRMPEYLLMMQPRLASRHSFAYVLTMTQLLPSRRWRCSTATVHRSC